MKKYERFRGKLPDFSNPKSRLLDEVLAWLDKQGYTLTRGCFPEKTLRCIGDKLTVLGSSGTSLIGYLIYADLDTIYLDSAISADCFNPHNNQYVESLPLYYYHFCTGQVSYFSLNPARTEYKFLWSKEL